MVEHPPQTYLYNFALNQDNSCVSLSTTSDFRTITLSPCLTEVSRRRVSLADSPSPVNVASMLFQTNYLALVLRDNPYKVLLWDDSLAQPPYELWSRFEVLNVVLRRDIVCVVSEYKIYVYEFGGSFLVLSHLETASNPGGICCISTGDPHSWVLACPGQQKGQVRIQIGLDDSISNTVSVHSNPVAALAINVEGTLVASASEQGTVVKVMSSKDGQLLYEFRRGSTPVGIACISFRSDSKFLILASASLTVHIFKLDEGVSSARGEWSTDTTSQGLLPKYFQSSRAYAQFKIPDTGSDLRVAGSPIVGPLCCFAKHKGNKIFVLHTNGLLYEAIFDDSKSDFGGRECMLTTASPFFQARPDFVIGQSSSSSAVTTEDESWSVI